MYARRENDVRVCGASGQLVPKCAGIKAADKSREKPRAMYSRELTRAERAKIRKLVVNECANYDYEYGCLPLDCECYMLQKWWTGAYCKWFQNGILPLDPALESALLGENANMRLCALCGKPFPEYGKKIYCSKECAQKAQRMQQRDHMRKKRDGC